MVMTEHIGLELHISALNLLGLIGVCFFSWVQNMSYPAHTKRMVEVDTILKGW